VNSTRSRSSGGSGALRRVGEQRPRLRSVPPYIATAGTEVIDLAERAGLVLDDWERWVLTEALGERADGKWAAWEVALIVSRQNGKNVIIEARELAGLFLFGERLITHTSHRFDTSLESFRRLLALIEANPDYDSQIMRVSRSHGEEGIELKRTRERPWDARILYRTRSESSGRGFSGDLLVFDEANILDSGSVGGSLPTLSARQHVTDGGPQVWYTASAGLGAKSTQLALVRRRGKAAHESGVPDPDLFFAEWSIEPCDEYCPPGCREHDDPAAVESLYKSNPGLGLIHSNGTGLTLESVERERGGMDETRFLIERLGVGIYPAPKDGWAVIPRRWWEATELRDAPRPAGVVFGVDTTPGREMSAIAVAGSISSDGNGYVELTADRRGQVDHRPGTSWVVRRAQQLDAEYGPALWVIDPRAAAGSLIDDFERSDLKILKPTATEMGHAFGEFYDAVRDDRLRHAPDKEVRSALAGAATRKLSDGQAWDRQNVAVDICPLVAYTLAWWGWRQQGGNDYDAGDSVHFDLTEIIRLCRLGAYGPADLQRLYDSGLINADGLTALAAAGIAVPGVREDA